MPYPFNTQIVRHNNRPVCKDDDGVNYYIPVEQGNLTPEKIAEIMDGADVYHPVADSK